MRNSTLWQRLAAAAAIGVMFALPGCQHLGTEPDKAAPTMAGDWRVDTANSDDFDRKLIPLMQQARHHDQPRVVTTEQGAGGGGNGQATAASAPPIEALGMPPEDPEKLRARLGDDLRPAAELRIAMTSGGVEITRDSDPAREFLPGQTVSRIDSSGAASVESGWDQGAFVIRAHYTTRGTRSWRLEHDTVKDTLRVTFQANNPEFGHLELHTLYRRASGSPSG
jgi:hypothetical protein